MQTPPFLYGSLLRGGRGDGPAYRESLENAALALSGSRAVLHAGDRSSTSGRTEASRRRSAGLRASRTSSTSPTSSSNRTRSSASRTLGGPATHGPSGRWRQRPTALVASPDPDPTTSTASSRRVARALLPPGIATVVMGGTVVRSVLDPRWSGARRSTMSAPRMKRCWCSADGSKPAGEGTRGGRAPAIAARPRSRRGHASCGRKSRPARARAA